MGILVTSPYFGGKLFHFVPEKEKSILSWKNGECEIFSGVPIVLAVILVVEGISKILTASFQELSGISKFLDSWNHKRENLASEALKIVQGSWYKAVIDTLIQRDGSKK